MVILRAFIESDVCASWIEIWRGDTLRELDSMTFNFFKSFYGAKNMSLACSFTDGDEDFNDFSEDYF